jgi:hypothetical protein
VALPLVNHLGKLFAPLGAVKTMPSGYAEYVLEK